MYLAGTGLQEADGKDESDTTVSLLIAIPGHQEHAECPSCCVALQCQRSDYNNLISQRNISEHSYL